VTRRGRVSFIQSRGEVNDLIGRLTARVRHPSTCGRRSDPRRVAPRKAWRRTVSTISSSTLANYFSKAFSSRAALCRRRGPSWASHAGVRPRLSHGNPHPSRPWQTASKTVARPSISTVRTAHGVEGFSRRRGGRRKSVGTLHVAGRCQECFTWR
jgi:hypothetical protein